MILNLTMHNLTEEQLRNGIVEPYPQDKEMIQNLLDFSYFPDPTLIESRALDLAGLARSYGADAAMIGGAPFLMSALEVHLSKLGIYPMYAFSKRESVEEQQEDGSMIKKNVFRHLGLVKGYISPDN